MFRKPDRIGLNRKTRQFTIVIYIYLNYFIYHFTFRCHVVITFVFNLCTLWSFFKFYCYIRDYYICTYRSPCWILSLSFVCSCVHICWLWIFSTWRRHSWKHFKTPLRRLSSTLASVVKWLAVFIVSSYMIWDPGFDPLPGQCS